MVDNDKDAKGSKVVTGADVVVAAKVICGRAGEKGFVVESDNLERVDSFAKLTAPVAVVAIVAVMDDLTNEDASSSSS